MFQAPIKTAGELARCFWLPFKVSNYYCGLTEAPFIIVFGASSPGKTKPAGTGLFFIRGAVFSQWPFAMLALAWRKILVISTC